MRALRVCVEREKNETKLYEEEKDEEEEKEKTKIGHSNTDIF